MTDVQDVCPICSAPFQKDEVLVRYCTWDKKQHSDKLGHADCVLYLSKIEKRKHPPMLEDRIDELEKSLNRTRERLAERITELGG